MDPKSSCIMVDDDILNFSLEDYEDKYHSSSSLASSNLSRSFHEYVEEELEYVEEELEWLSNKDAFPAVEYDLFSNYNPNLSVTFDHQSPVSVLENSVSNSNGSCKVNGKENAFIRVPINYPVRARSKTRRRRSAFAELTSEHCVWGNRKLKLKNTMKQEPTLPMSKGARRASNTGRRCQHCGVDKTPQWRFGPMGPKTLCNACGVRYKSGRLFPEYRPANSPTFSAHLHSNSHRKVLEMRKQTS